MRIAHFVCTLTPTDTLYRVTPPLGTARYLVVCPALGREGTIMYGATATGAHSRYFLNLLASSPHCNHVQAFADWGYLLDETPQRSNAHDFHN